MKKAIGFNLGQRGDLIVTTVCAKAFKSVYPDYHLVLGVGPQYQDMLPLFYQHPYFDNFHVYEAYDKWPNQEDIKYLNEVKYDMVFDGMPQHRIHNWWEFYHLCQETCDMHGLPIPKDYECILTKWFNPNSDFKNYIAFAPFAAFYNKETNLKKISIEKAQKLVDSITKLGYNILHVGGHDEPILNNTIKFKTSYFESVKNLLGCKAFLHTDTGLAWVASAYQFNCLGLYSYSYYGEKFAKQLYPVNKNAIYLQDYSAENINNELIIDKLKTLL